MTKKASNPPPPLSFWVSGFLGCNVVDKITKRSGVIKAVAYHLHNSTCVCVQPVPNWLQRLLRPGMEESWWIENHNLAITEVARTRGLLVNRSPSLCDPQVRLGDTAKDTLSGLEGVVVGITFWINGCVRVGLQPKGLEAGKPIEPVYVSDRQILVTERAEVTADDDPPGGPVCNDNYKARG